MARLERAYLVSHKADVAEKKICKAIRDGVITKKTVMQALDDARAKNVINEDEFKTLQESDHIRYDEIGCKEC